jgi:hypothetical protein
MTEQAMWHALRKAVLSGPGVHAYRVENLVGVGTPDVTWAWKGKEGWLELKHAKKWPQKGGALRLPHFTKEQRLWHRRRTSAGGRVHVLLQCGTDWGLFTAETAADVLGSSSYEELLSVADGWWFNIPERLAFLRMISS